MTGIPPAKAFIFEVDNPLSKVDFHFNPTSLHFSKSAEYRRETRPGSNEPPVQFQGSAPTELKVDLLLDAMERQPVSDVQAKVERLLAWTSPSKLSIGTRSPSPPELQFIWGTLTIGGASTFKGHLLSVDVTYQLFSRTGDPLRAEVSITLSSKPEEPRPTNPSSGGLRPQRAHVMTRGDTVQSVTFATYGDPGYWRAVAEANDIDDPLRVAVGTKLLLPDTSELERSR